MTQYSVAEAKNHLSERMLAGADIVITRDGDPVVSPQTLRPAAKPVTPDDLDWLALHRVQMTGGTDAGTLLSVIRDEDGR